VQAARTFGRGARQAAGIIRARRLHFSRAMTGADHLTDGALLGLVGGLVAAGAMSLAHRVASAIAPKAEAPPASSEKDSTVKVASAVTRQVGYSRTLRPVNPFVEKPKNSGGTHVDGAPPELVRRLLLLLRLA